MSSQSFCIFFPAISFALESTLPHNQSVPLRQFGFLLFASSHWSKQYYSIEIEESYHSFPRTNESQQDVKQWRVAQKRNAACMRLLAPREFWRQNCLDLLLSIEYSYFKEFSEAIFNRLTDAFKSPLRITNPPTQSTYTDQSGIISRQHWSILLNIKNFQNLKMKYERAFEHLESQLFRQKLVLF